MRGEVLMMVEGTPQPTGRVRQLAFLGCGTIDSKLTLYLIVKKKTH